LHLVLERLDGRDHPLPQGRFRIRKRPSAHPSARLLRQPRPAPAAAREGSTRDFFMAALAPHYRRDNKIMALIVKDYR